jgi:hypothetical protein
MLKCLKGLSHEMNLAFEDMHGQLGLNRGRGQFLNFVGGCSKDFKKQKVYFSQ